METVRIGQFQVDRVVEYQGPFAPLEFIVPEVDMARVEAHSDWIRPRYLSDEGKLVMSFHSYVLQTPHHRILIDSCVGNDKQRPARPTWHQQQGPYLQSLATLGLKPEDIDFVCCTHLHADHVGWNTRLQDGRWVPTFPKARYVFARSEYAHWEQAHRHALSRGEPAINHGSFADSVLPVVDAGQAELVGDDFEFESGVYLGAARGHTPGTCCLHAQSQGAKGLFSGDVLHTPIQLLDLSWNSRFCEDPALAAQTRRSLVESVADTSTLLLAGHFPHATAGRVVSRAGGLGWSEVG